VQQIKNTNVPTAYS